MSMSRRPTRLPEGVIRKPLKNISYLQTRKVVCDVYGLSEDELNKDTRKREIVEARQVFSYFMTLNRKRKLSNIGKVFDKAHDFVCYSRTQIENFIETDRRFREHITMIANRLIESYN